MDEKAVDAPRSTSAWEAAVVSVDGIEVISYAAVIDRLSADHPGIAPARIEAVLLREWDAYSAGRPLVVPVAVEAGVREVLGGL